MVYQAGGWHRNPVHVHTSNVLRGWIIALHWFTDQQGRGSCPEPTVLKCSTPLWTADMCHVLEVFKEALSKSTKREVCKWVADQIHLIHHSKHVHVL